MKAGWEVKPLGEVIEPLETVDPRKAPDDEFTYIDVSSVSRDLLTVSEVTNLMGEVAPSRARRKVRTNDVIFATIRPTLKRIAIIPPSLDEAVCSTGYMVLRAKAELDSRFLFYVLQSEEFGSSMETLQRGASYPAVSDGDIKTQAIPIPPLEEQKRIVAALDAAFEGLTRAKENAEANLQNARDLFESYLGEIFSSDQADWTQTTVKQMVDAGVLQRPMDGNHGEVHPKKADFVDAGIPFIMASDLFGGVVDQTTCNFLSREQADSLRKGFAKDGDILLSHKGTIGRTAILSTKLDYVMLTPQVTFYRVLDLTKLRPEFLYFAFQSASFKRELGLASGDGATRAYIGITKQLDLHLSYPSLESQAHWVKRFKLVERETKKAVNDYQSKLQDIADLGQSLLQKAFSGALT